MSPTTVFTDPVSSLHVQHRLRQENIREIIAHVDHLVLDSREQYRQEAEAIQKTRKERTLGPQDGKRNVLWDVESQAYLREIGSSHRHCWTLRRTDTGRTICLIMLLAALAWQYNVIST